MQGPKRVDLLRRGATENAILLFVGLIKLRDSSTRCVFAGFCCRLFGVLVSPGQVCKLKYVFDSVFEPYKS